MPGIPAAAAPVRRRSPSAALIRLEHGAREELQALRQRPIATPVAGMADPVWLELCWDQGLPGDLVAERSLGRG